MKVSVEFPVLINENGSAIPNTLARLAEIESHGFSVFDLLVGDLRIVKILGGPWESPDVAGPMSSSDKWMEFKIQTEGPGTTAPREIEVSDELIALSSKSLDDESLVDECISEWKKIFDTVLKEF